MKGETMPNLKTGDYVTVGYYSEKTHVPFDRVENRVAAAGVEAVFTLNGLAYFGWADVFEAENGRPWCPDPEAGADG